MTGDIALAFDRRLPATETAGAPVAQAAETTASEAVFARCVFAHMFTPPPPPIFGPLSFASNSTRLRRVAARSERARLPSLIRTAVALDAL